MSRRPALIAMVSSITLTLVFLLLARHSLYARWHVFMMQHDIGAYERRFKALDSNDPTGIDLVLDRLESGSVHSEEGARLMLYVKYRGEYGRLCVLDRLNGSIDEDGEFNLISLLALVYPDERTLVVLDDYLERMSERSATFRHIEMLREGVVQGLSSKQNLPP